MARLRKHFWIIILDKKCALILKIRERVVSRKSYLYDTHLYYSKLWWNMQVFGGVGSVV